MANPAGDRQKSIMEFIQQYLGRNGYPPSVREIGAAVGLRSTASVARYLKILESQGFISHPPMKRRAWSLSGTGHESSTVPVIGKITAGQPILATEQIEDQWQIPVSLFHLKADFLLRVVGDSMIDAGIREDDLVAVQSTSTVDNGEIVIALIGDDATVKYLDRSDGRLRLIPANPNYEPIEDPDITVIGRVVGLIRSY
ncbi:MAG: transcriptional repressor LexA [Sulfobacillus sp.]